MQEATIARESEAALSFFELKFMVMGPICRQHTAEQLYDAEFHLGFFFSFYQGYLPVKVLEERNQ